MDEISEKELEILDKQRAKRFIQSEKEFSKSANFNKIRPFFDGESLTGRMDKIREGIILIRENWEKYEDFAHSLHEYIKENVENKEAKEMLENILKSRKDWAKSEDGVDGDFDVIKLYTSVKGYNAIFSMINRVFRDDTSTNYKELIRNAVFMVELINIDLFNYCLRHEKYHNFTGVVYRGMALKEDDLGAFEVLRKKDITNRYIAIPLSLLSSSSSLRVARSFIKRETREKIGHKPLLMKIHVIELQQDYIEYYKARFPTSVLSTICAVDIKNLSLMSHEKEVILRGPFFQILDFYDGEIVEDQLCKVLEMVMVNINRDHISTMQLGPESAAARQIFGNMVAVSRCKFAIKYFEEKECFDEAEEYRKLLNEKLGKLKELMEA